MTALNLLPVGGHMADARLGRRLSAGVETAAMASLIFLGLFVWSGLLTWALVVYLVAGEKPPGGEASSTSARGEAIGSAFD